MESEQGKFAKFGAIQNRKLRREVTTISRMTHKNIVRYYQGWVEGAGVVQEEVAGVMIQEEEEDADADADDNNANDQNDNNKVDAGDVLATEDRESDDDDDDDDDNEGKSSGWWTNSPNERDLPLEMTRAKKQDNDHESSSSSSGNSSNKSSSSTSWSDSEGVATAGDAKATANADDGAFSSSKNFKRTASSLSDFLENENEHNFGVSQIERAGTRFCFHAHTYNRPSSNASRNDFLLL